MKRYLYIIFSTLLSGFCYGQSSNVGIYSEDGTTLLSGSTFEIIGNKNDAELNYAFVVKNTGQKDISVFYQRVKTEENEYVDQICDNNLCYTATQTETYTTPVEDILVMNQNSLFKPQILPQGNEVCASYMYYIINPTGIRLDSIQIIFRTEGTDCSSSLNVDKNESEMFRVYPNPGHDIITIYGKGKMIVFVDALGKETMRVNSYGIQNSVDISKLTNGVYFLYLLNNEGIKSKAQRFIKQ